MAATNELTQLLTLGIFLAADNARWRLLQPLFNADVEGHRLDRTLPSLFQHFAAQRCGGVQHLHSPLKTRGSPLCHRTGKDILRHRDALRDTYRRV
jgi:hypothetical protein